MSSSLKEVTYLTMKKLKKNDVILPQEYDNIFKSFAKDLNIDMENKEQISQDLHKEYAKVEDIVSQTNENINLVKESTTMAKKAIKNKDEKSLEQINEHLHKMQEKIDFLQKELFSDTLTKAYNRKWFMDSYLEDDKFTSNGYLCFIDVNKFKGINDTYGHIVGDQVLKYLVRFLQTEITINDAKVVRYAGDEFMVLFDDKINKIVLEKELEKAQKKLSVQKLKSSKINSLQFSFSYGLIHFKIEDELENIINIADELMYENKKKEI